MKTKIFNLIRNSLPLFFLLFSSLTISKSHAFFFEVKVSPFPIGVSSQEVGLGITNHLGIGYGIIEGDLTPNNFTHKVDIKEKHYRLEFGFNGIYAQGFYLALMKSEMKLHLVYTPITLSSTSTVYTTDLRADGNILEIGYRWQWDYFFMQYALQTGSFDFPKDVVLYASDGSTYTSTMPSVSATGGIFNLGIRF